MTRSLFPLPDSTCKCGRCGAGCEVDPIAGSKARMLRRSAAPKGLCVNCAAYDWLRNTYPVNLILARSGPKGLALPHVQEQFAAIMRMGCSDAMPDEIDWQRIAANWDLPFPNKIKKSTTNPVSQKELDREKNRPDDHTMFLAEQECRAKDAADRDRALRDLCGILHPGKKVHITDNGQGSIGLKVDNE